MTIMQIVCIKSCAVDRSAINGLRTQCLGRFAPNCQSSNITGRYILAYDGDKLVGVADAFGEEQICVAKPYLHFGVEKALNAALAAV